MHQTTPAGNSVLDDILALADTLRPSWAERHAAIPAWHPRNETPDPTVAPPPGENGQVDWDSPDNPYLGRFRDTQAAYTQGQQRLAQLDALERDPQAYIELGRRQGWIEVDEPAPDPNHDPRLAELHQQTAAYEQRLAQLEARAQQEQIAAGEEMFHSDLDSWAEQEGIKLSKADHNAIFGMLMRSPDPTQEAAARQIFEAHVAHKKADRDAIEAEIRESMRRPRVPTPPPGGGPHTGQPNWREMSEADINEYMAQRALGNV